MKMRVEILTISLLCLSVSSLAGYSDGYITAGEYEGFVTWTSYNPPLIVEGGGAVSIDVRSSGRLEVRYTSIPINNNWNTGGITDIWLDDFSILTYLGGQTEEITVTENSSAVLKGGRIDGITSLQNVVAPRIEMFVRDYEYDVISKILTGTWNADLDNNSQWDTFNIQLVNDPDYDPTIENIKFTIVPEPASLLLLSLGGLMIHRRKR